MKDQYFGDVNDYLKYGLLRCFADSGLSVGVCWMLTPNDNRADGGKMSYLFDEPRWRWHDPELYDALKATVGSGDERRVRIAEDGSLIPGATFFPEAVPDSATGRQTWRGLAIEAFADRDLIFFDPDNGLEVRGKPIGTANSKKYLAWADVTETWRSGASLVVFQHFARINRETYTADLAARVAEATPGSRVIPLRTANVLFLVAEQPDHRRRIERGLALAGERWGDRILRVGEYVPPPKSDRIEISDGALREVEAALGRYTTEMRRSHLDSGSKRAYADHADAFVRWLGGDVDAGSG